MTKIFNHVITNEFTKYKYRPVTTLYKPKGLPFQICFPRNFNYYSSYKCKLMITTFSVILLKCNSNSTNILCLAISYTNLKIFGHLCSIKIILFL